MTLNKRFTEVSKHPVPGTTYHVYQQGDITLHITDCLIGENSPHAAQYFFDRVRVTPGLDVLGTNTFPQYVRTYRGKPPSSRSSGEYAIFISDN